MRQVFNAMPLTAAEVAEAKAMFSSVLLQDVMTIADGSEMEIERDKSGVTTIDWEGSELQQGKTFSVLACMVEPGVKFIFVFPIVCWDHATAPEKFKACVPREWMAPAGSNLPYALLKND